jgi:hypothetical protein
MNAVLIATVFAGMSLAQAKPRVEASWTPAVYRGLTVGVSTNADAFRVLGNPRFSGKEPDTGLPIMTYAVSEPVRGELTVYLKRDVIDGMTLIPENRLTKKEAVKLFGSDYLQVSYASDDCLTEAGSAPIYESPDGHIEHLEYRARGRVLILHDDVVVAVAFVHKAFGPPHSRCK